MRSSTRSTIALIDRVPLDRVIILSSLLRLDLVASAPRLAGADVEMVGMIDA